MAGAVRLTGYRPDDATAIATAFQDFQTTRWLSAVPFPYARSDAQDFIAQAGADDFAIRVDGRFAGGVRAGDDLGYWVLPEFRRQGIGLRAAVLALSRRFAAGRKRISASYQPENTASGALLTRLGFADPQQITAFSRPLGREVPMLRVTASREDVAARHGIDLITPRLRLNPPTPGDLSALYDIATHPQVAPMLLRFAPGMPMEEFAPLISMQALVPPFRLAIRQDGRVIGSIGIGALTGEGPPPIYYFLAPDCWGRGLGREVLTAFLAEIDARFDPPVLGAEVFADNPASGRLLEQSGFRPAGDGMRTSRGRDRPSMMRAYLRQRPQPA